MCYVEKIDKKHNVYLTNFRILSYCFNTYIYIVQLCEKETVDIDILAWREKNQAIYQNNEQTSLEIKKMEPVEPVMKNIYQSNTYRKQLNRSHFDAELSIQEMQQVKDEQSCLFIFVAFLTIASRKQGHQPRRDNSIPYIVVWYIYRDTKQPQKKATLQNESKLQLSWTQFQQQR